MSNSQIFKKSKNEDDEVDTLDLKNELGALHATLAQKKKEFKQLGASLEVNNEESQDDNVKQEGGKKKKSSKKSSKKTSKTLERPVNQYFKTANELRVFVKKQIPEESFNVVSAMSKAMAKVINANDRDIDKIKKNFDKAAFLKDYNSEKKAYLAKQAAKKAA